jgi:hypothetical protein
MTQSSLRRISITIVLAACACGKTAGSTKTKDDAQPAGPNVAPLAMPALGIDSVKRMNFIYAEGAAAYEKAFAAYKAKPHDWNAIKSNCEVAIARDPMHFDAHRLLATALAQLGEHAAAVDHLVTALAADYYQYAPSLVDDEDLKGFLATPHGQSVSVLAQKIKAEYAKRIASGVLLVARRSTFKWPSSTGVQVAASRGELYAFDRETKRFLRLTHTNHQVAGFVRAPSGNETAVLGFDKVDRSKEDSVPAVVARGWVIVLDGDWNPVGKRANLPSAREIAVGYGAGDQLLVTTAQATGRWTVDNPVVSAVDRTTGALTKVTAAPPALRIAMTLDEGRVVRAPDGIAAAWSGDPPTTSSFKTATGAAIQVPESGAAARSSVALSPNGARVAFATAVDPCAKDTAPSLYVADAKTGVLKHVLTAKSRFATRWIDPTTLAYEDGDGAIRLWDATSQHEALRLDNRAGLALDVLSSSNAPLCKQAPPAIEPAGSAEEPLPPEGGGATGPVTAPTP